MAPRKATMPKRNKKNFRPTKSGAGMTKAGVKKYRAMNPGSKLKTAVTTKPSKLKKYILFLSFVGFYFGLIFGRFAILRTP